jgi:hypothetical protein
MASTPSDTGRGRSGKRSGQPGEAWPPPFGFPRIAGICPASHDNRQEYLYRDGWHRRS